MRKVCVVTGSRAEYGLLRWVMEGIRRSPTMELQVVACGMHLSPRFGLTYREIEADGLFIDQKVEMLLASDTPVGIAKSIGVGTMGFADAFARLKPDLLVVLGDRFEILAAVSAALVFRIPVAHIHGGEVTQGAVDDSIRHAITKMSHLHFVAAEEYRRRVIQLGEDPGRVFLVGGLGVDRLHRLQLLNRQALEDALGFRLGRKNLLVTYHPVTLEESAASRQMAELLAALEGLQDTCLLFTMPNADMENQSIIELIQGFVATHPNAHAYASLGSLKYLSCLRHVDGVVGNSSSGLTEAPSFHIGTVNIGDRQRGRIKAESVIDCAPERKSIRAAIDKLYDAGFRSMLPAVKNPYGDGGASDLIVGILENLDWEGISKKLFFDIKMDAFPNGGLKRCNPG